MGTNRACSLETPRGKRAAALVCSAAVFRGKMSKAKGETVELAPRSPFGAAHYHGKNSKSRGTSVNSF